MIFVRIIIPLWLFLSMTFFRKPVSTFRDHALARAESRNGDPSCKAHANRRGHTARRLRLGRPAHHLGGGWSIRGPDPRRRPFAKARIVASRARSPAVASRRFGRRVFAPL